MAPVIVKTGKEFMTREKTATEKNYNSAETENQLAKHLSSDKMRKTDGVLTLEVEPILRTSCCFPGISSDPPAHPRDLLEPADTD